jgi:hypothetical protein
MAKISRDFLRRHRATFALSLLLAGGAILYAQGAATNPPGFFIDESSVAYNAHLIAQTGHDEHGEAWPLYFRAFSEYKNPTHIYLLAALFRMTGPSIAVARYLSAAAGVLTALVLGLLGVRLSGRHEVGPMITLTTLLTPWLFELSRVVMEVALYPLALALFLLCVHRASVKLQWSWTDMLALAAMLALLTYTYSIGRLLAPLLAFGLLFFMTRARWRAILFTWGLYLLSLGPMVIFQIRNPPALMQRFKLLTYIKPESTVSEIAWTFVKHYVGNLNPWRLFVSEHSNVSEIIHIPGAQPILFTTVILAAGGVYLFVRRRRVDAWWRFVIYGLVISIVPASLTNEYFHMLRLCAVPVFLIVLTIPALGWLVEERSSIRQRALGAILVLTLSQGLIFQYQYRANARTPRRLHLFDADYPAKILPTALAASQSRTIFLADAPSVPGYIQAYWYATLQRIPLDKFVLLAPDQPEPDGETIISTESGCPRCLVLAESEPYVVCVARGAPRTPAPLPDSGFHAELSVLNAPLQLRRGEQTTIEVLVKNASDTLWLTRERTVSPFQLNLANHWLDQAGRIIVNDDGRGPPPHDLRPGEAVQIRLTVNAPRRAGTYQLEIDMLQESVSWFGLKGSQTWRGVVTVVDD